VAEFDFSRARRRGRFEAWILDKSAARTHQHYGRTKSEVLGAIAGTVVEIGPATGPNMRYYPPGVRVIGIEPNPAMHERLRDKAEQHSVNLEIRTVRGEGIDVEDESADAVVATLLLCGVDDPTQVLSEVRRVLRPGGTFFFIEHVVAPEGSGPRRVQSVLKRPHRWIFSGCEVDRDTATAISMAGFSDVSIEAVDLGRSGLYTRHQIVGTATR
jgi:SAM-dependent methyltransferase